MFKLITYSVICNPSLRLTAVLVYNLIHFMCTIYSTFILVLFIFLLLLEPLAVKEGLQTVDEGQGQMGPQVADNDLEWME